MQTVNILGTEYKIIRATKEENKKLERALGYCDYTTKEIFIEDISRLEETEDTVGNLKESEKRVLRHEIIHAFLFESGLGYDTIYDWATNEEMVDFFARQMPKMFNVYNKIDVI